MAVRSRPPACAGHPAQQGEKSRVFSGKGSRSVLGRYDVGPTPPSPSPPGAASAPPAHPPSAVTAPSTSEWTAADSRATWTAAAAPRGRRRCGKRRGRDSRGATLCGHLGVRDPPVGQGSGPEPPVQPALIPGDPRQLLQGPRLEGNILGVRNLDPRPPHTLTWPLLPTQADTSFDCPCWRQRLVRGPPGCLSPAPPASTVSAGAADEDAVPQEPCCGVFLRFFLYSSLYKMYVAGGPSPMRIAVRCSGGGLTASTLQQWMADGRENAERGREGGRGARRLDGGDDRAA